MPAFEYIGRNSSGDRVNGILEADVAEQVADQLLRTGVTPLQIRARVESPSSGGGLARYFQPKVRLEEVVMLSRQLRTLLKAGVPILRSLRGLADTSKNPSLRTALEDVHQQLEGGRELNVALAQHRSIFSSLFVALVRIGESTGRLDQAFGHLAEYLEQEKVTRERIKPLHVSIRNCP